MAAILANDRTDSAKPAGTTIPPVLLNTILLLATAVVLIQWTGPNVALYFLSFTMNLLGLLRLLRQGVWAMNTVFNLLQKMG